MTALKLKIMKRQHERVKMQTMEERYYKNPTKRLLKNSYKSIRKDRIPKRKLDKTFERNLPKDNQMANKHK